MSLDTNFFKKKYSKNININENLAKYSWFNLGGPADLLFKPSSKKQLINFVKDLHQQNLDLKILGAGSNTLIRDAGVRGVVIKLGSKFTDIKLLEKDIIEVGAGTLDRKISNFAKDNNISGMEFLSCIPGSIGGSITMNSGCYGYDISKILISVNVIDNKGNEREIKKEDINFYYRGSSIPNNYIIISSKLKGVISKKKQIETKQEMLIERKKRTQPNQIKTCGSTFKNSENKKAWELIKDSGCSNLSVGDAKISNKHCNFFLNAGNAKTLDIENLINKVKKEVKSKTGINLELEIKIIGNEK